MISPIQLIINKMKVERQFQFPVPSNGITNLVHHMIACKIIQMQMDEEYFRGPRLLKPAPKKEPDRYFPAPVSTALRVSSFGLSREERDGKTANQGQ